MEQKLAKRTEAAYPYRFFCEERYLAEAVKELVCEAYIHLVTDRYVGGGPVALGTLAAVMMGVFNIESVARMLLRGDYYGGELGDIMGSSEQIVALFLNAKVPVDFFVDQLFADYEFLLTQDAQYLEWFAADLNHALKELGLFYLASQFDVPSHQYFYRGQLDGKFKTDSVKSLPPLSECLVNCPIVEVW